MWPHELVPTPLNCRQLWGAQHLPTVTQRHYSIFCSVKQKIQRRQNNKIAKDEADIEIKIQRGLRKRIKSAPCFSLIASELVMLILLLIIITDFHSICQDPGSQDLAKGVWAQLLVSGS